jgi:hypothetical protein
VRRIEALHPDGQWRPCGHYDGGNTLINLNLTNAAPHLDAGTTTISLTLRFETLEAEWARTLEETA